MSQRVLSASYSSYAPLRFEITRQGCQKIAERYKYLIGKAELHEVDSKISHDTMVMYKNLMPPSLDAFKILRKESGKMLSYVEFFSSNRMIYDFHKSLTSALLETDIDKINLDNIPKPHEHFYLHFGNYSWPDGYPPELEGVYVSFRSNLEEGKSMYFDPVFNHQFATPLHVNTERESISGNFEIFFSDVTEGIEEYLARSSEEISFENSTLVSPDGPPIFEVFNEVCKRDPGNPKQNALVAKIAINCMLYLAAVPDDVEHEWEDRAPANLVELSLRGEKEGTRKTAERTLANQHYLKVRIVGRAFSRSHDSININTHKKATHVRKGHFRNQAYGPEWTMHRIIFIAPKVINPGSGEMPGRIFEV